MTEKLYEMNTMLRECEATVMGCEPLKKGYGILLDKTCFFPEGGGQLSDEGELVTSEGKKLHITHVSEKEGKILHHCKDSVAIGTQVQAVLDWSVRLDRMQHHYGEHTLAYSFWKLFGANNIGFHMSEDAVAINLDQPISLEQADEAELYANTIIWEDRPFHAVYMTKETADRLPMRKRNDNIQGMVRVVSFEDGDCCMCCGTQPTSTGVIGLIKIMKLVSIKEGTRVEFLCGKRALLDIRKKIKAVTEAGNTLSTQIEKVPKAIEKLKTELAATKEDLRKKSNRLLQPDIDQMLQAGKLDNQGNRILSVISETYDDGLAKLLVKRLVTEEKVVIAVIYCNAGRIHYCIARSTDVSVDCRPIIKKANALFGGKGGGKPELCQGSAAETADWKLIAEQVIRLL